MQYQECRLGRIFVARLSDGESIYSEIEELAATEGIQSGMVFTVGGIRKGAVVTGPENPHSLKDIVTLVERFDDAREMVGFGTLFPADGKSTLHFHAAMGRGDKAIVGCPRIEADCFLILEVVIIELVGLNAERVSDPETGFRLLQLLGAS